jgi:pyrroline-5-carboxylate reductase
MKPLVFLGGGRITGALVAGLRLSGYKAPIVVHDRNPGKLRVLKKKHGIIAEPNLQHAVGMAGILIIAVRPASVAALLEEIAALPHPTMAVSLAAGIRLAQLRARLGLTLRWARAMPSPACRSGNGLTALAFEGKMPARMREQVSSLFARVGPVLQVSESKFDAFTVTYSSSHGYHALAALSQAAQKLGLDRRTALTAAAHALADGIIAWRKGSLALEALLHEAATPGGIAATAINAMDDAGYARAIERGLRAGMTRAQRMAD